MAPIDGSTGADGRDRNRILIQGGVVLSMVADEEPRRSDVFIQGNRIIAVGPSVPPFRLEDATTVIDARDCLLMPGLINAHTHTPMTLTRSTSDDAGPPSADGTLAFPMGKDWRGHLTPEDHYWSSRLAIAEMIRSGTTTFVDMYRDMDQVARAVIDTGVRGALGSEILTIRNDSKQWLPYDERTARRTFDECGRFAAEWRGKGEGRVMTLIAPHETSTCHEPWLSRSARLAEEMKLGVTLHVAESRAEVDFCRDKYGLTPVEALRRAGILDHRVIGAHSLILTEADIAILAGVTYTAAACLGCYVKLAMDVTPAPRLLRAGVNVALGTDGAATNNNLNMWEEIQLNATLHGFIARDATIMPGDAAIRMATVGGARALGLEQDLGTLEAGKKADVIVLDLRKPHLCPDEGALIGNLSYSANGSEVRDVLVDGRALMLDTRIVAFDENEVLREVEAIVRRRRAAVGLPFQYRRPVRKI
jgi:5-methylthioadenosine/S-adenosylhomocysteine deaminase